jgi:protocatechuate 3,4-dioxygenase alpha subunit
MPVQLLPETPSQTAGPYVHIGLALEAAGNAPREQEIWNDMAKPGAPGEHILLLGHVYDGNGHLIRDAFLEFWQANHDGVYDSAYDLENRSTVLAVPPRPMSVNGRSTPSNRAW